MPKQKNTSYDRYHITLSPRTMELEDAFLWEQYDKFYKTVIPLSIRHAVVVESGSEQSHLHMHLLVHFKKNYRIDHLKRKYQKLLKKLCIYSSKYSLKVTPAYNPTYLLTEYFNKQSNAFYKGYDINQILTSFEVQRRTLYKDSNKNIKLTRQTLYYLIKKHSPNIEFPPLITLSYHSEFIHAINELTHSIEESGHDITYVLWNKKTYLTLIKWIIYGELFSHEEL